VTTKDLAELTPGEKGKWFATSCFAMATAELTGPNRPSPCPRKGGSSKTRTPDRRRAATELLALRYR
jgi:hypothetical protein